MTVSISEPVRRRIGLALCDRDAANAFCDAIESTSTAAAAAVATQYISIPLGDLDAGDDISDVGILGLPVAITIDSLTLIAHGDYAGVDDANTMAVTVKDGDGNTIVTKTFNDSTAIPDGLDGLGTPDVTNKLLAANEACSLDIVCGATADPPDLSLLVGFHVT